MSLAAALLQWLDQHITLFQSTTLLLLLLLSLLLLLLLGYRISAREIPQLPPSPPKLPIIGNLHQLGSLPHRSLRDLSRKHGLLMALQLGAIPTLVVSSAELAREIMKTHDLDFLNRPSLSSARQLLYDCKDVSFSPYGEYWRQVRKICIMELLSAKRVHSFRIVREEEIGNLIVKISDMCEGSGSVNLSEMLLSLTNDIICKVAFGKKYVESEGDREVGFVEMGRELTVLLGSLHVGDFFPGFEWVDVLTGMRGRVRRIFEGLDRFLEEVIGDHIANGRDRDGGREDFVDVMLQVQKDCTLDVPLTKDNLKGVILDMFVGGTDTTTSALEWAMAELIKHPEIMKKAQAEVRRVVSCKSKVEEDDLEQMDYLKSVIKETFRLHPPLPLLVPRESIRPTKIHGYTVPAKTRVLINAWAIGRDPRSWERAEEFQPERFNSSPMDFRGQDFMLIPFGAGRRSCPGTAFAVTTIEVVLANLLHQFDWAQPNGASAKDLDMDERSGLTVHKKTPLLLTAVPFLA